MLCITAAVFFCSKGEELLRPSYKGLGIGYVTQRSQACEPKSPQLPALLAGDFCNHDWYIQDFPYFDEV